MKKRITKNSVKETFDDLPVGICFFDRNGIPVLCNLQMHRLIFAITGRDLQVLSDLTNGLRDFRNKDEGLLLLPDGTAWQFRVSTVMAEEEYLQYVASDVTELYKVKKALEADNAQYARMLKSIRTISDNVVAITREEELLALKTRIHGKVGVCLQRLRSYILQNGTDRNADSMVFEMQTVADMLMGEIGKDDEPKLMEELFAVAKKLGVAIKVQGELPEKGEAAVLLAYTLQECLTNTVGHAGGNELYVDLTSDAGILTAVITDNGKPPKGEITEGGGLSSLRRRLEKAGGTMTLQSRPRFTLTAVYPMDKEEIRK